MQINEISGCCAVDEIAYLNENNNAVESMKDLCREVYGDEYDQENMPAYMRRYRDECEAKPAAHYVFTAVVGYKGRVQDKPKYGPSFAALIKKNKLGSVVQTKSMNNRVHHPNHMVRAYIWTPAPRALKAWWKKNKPKVEKPDIKLNNYGW